MSEILKQVKQEAAQYLEFHTIDDLKNARFPDFVVANLRKEEKKYALVILEIPHQVKEE